MNKRDELAEALNSPFYTWNGSGPNHVEDAARAFLRLLDGMPREPKDDTGSPYDIGYFAALKDIRAIIGEEWFKDGRPASRALSPEQFCECADCMKFRPI